jgi:hypothetical protein
MFALIAARPKIIAGDPSRVASAAEPDAAVATLASRGEMHMLLRRRRSQQAQTRTSANLFEFARHPSRLSSRHQDVDVSQWATSALHAGEGSYTARTASVLYVIITVPGPFPARSK